MRKIFKGITNKNTDYFIVKRKNDNSFIEIARYKNNMLNRFILAHKKFNKNGEYYIVCELQHVEGYYYKVN